MVLVVLEPDVVTFACDHQQVEEARKHHHRTEQEQLPERGEHEARKHGRGKAEVP